jgi:hypothetical protein
MLFVAERLLNIVRRFNDGREGEHNQVAAERRLKLLWRLEFSDLNRRCRDWNIRSLNPGDETPG